MRFDIVCPDTFTIGRFDGEVTLKNTSLTFDGVDEKKIVDDFA